MKNMGNASVIHYLKLHITNNYLEKKTFQLPRFLDLFSTDKWQDDNTFISNGVSIKADIGNTTYKEFLVQLPFWLWQIGFIGMHIISGEKVGDCYNDIIVNNINPSDFSNRIIDQYRYVLSPFNMPQAAIMDKFQINANTIIEFDISDNSSYTLILCPAATIDVSAALYGVK